MKVDNPFTVEVANEIKTILLEKLFDNNQEYLNEISHSISVYQYEIENGIIELIDNDHFKTFATHMLDHLFTKSK